MEAAPNRGLSREERLTQMVSAYQKPLLTLCYAYLQDSALAEDAVQEAFLRAYRGMRAFREESGEKTWLTRIAINVCRDMRRSAWNRHVQRDTPVEELPIPAEGGFDQEAHDLAQGIARLPAKYREAILLRYYQALPLQEVARVIGLTPSMASRRVKKACELLRDILGKEYLHG